MPSSLSRRNRRPRRDVIAFAHRGGLDHAPENTIPAFLNARRMGATAVETDAWITRDGVVVLDHDGVVWQGNRRVPIADVDFAALPGHIPSLEEYYDIVGTHLELAIDAHDARIAAAIVDVARRAGDPALEKLWLCAPNLGEAEGWRGLDPVIHLVHSADLWELGGDPAAHARYLASRGIEALNLHEDDCTPQIAAACHAAGVMLFGWNAHTQARAERLLAIGVDGLYGNNIPALQQAIASRERGLG